MDKLLLAYESRVRVCVEGNIPLWKFSINKSWRKKIEDLQKVSFFVILGKEASKDYFCNLAILNATPLEDRRERIVENFAKKILKHPEHRKMFSFAKESGTRAGKRIIIPKCKTSRYENSAVPSLARIIDKKQNITTKPTMTNSSQYNYVFVL